MAVIRRNNVLSQERIDVPAFRSIESAVSADFDLVAESFIAGTDSPYILNGFELNLTGSWVSTPASSLQVVVANGALLHTTASQSGTFYLVPAGTPNEVLNASTNSNVYGAFVPSALNYVGIDYYRFQDPGTDTQVYLWDPTSNDEDQAIAPAAIVMDYEFVISQSIWASNILPIAVVQTDSSNNVISVTDARPLLFRLGTGGASPNPFYVYPWPEGQTENPVTSSSNSSNPFYGGDKGITDLKDWMNAVMSQILEIIGGQYWYSPVSGSGGGGSIADLREDAVNTILTGNGNITHSATTAGLVNWSSTLNLTIVGSNLNYQVQTNPTGTTVTLSDGQVAYLTLSRDVVITAANLSWTNGSPTVTSVGNIPWTSGLYSINANGYGDWIKVASATHAGYYQIQAIVNTYTVTLSSNYTGTTSGSSGDISQYAYGLYTLPGVTSTSRDIQIASRGLVPINSSTSWLFSRNDNGGAIPRVFVRWLGLDLQQGDEEEISGPQLQNVLDYIGSPIESATEPQYVSAYNIWLGNGPTVLPQITSITTGAASTMASNQYFIIYSSASGREYVIWVNKDGTGTDPTPIFGATDLEWSVTTGQTDAQTATILQTLLNTTFNKDFSVDISSNVLTVTNTSAGVTASPSNFNVGSPFAISVTQAGTGSGNYIISDGDDLTLAVKKLDEGYGVILGSLDSPTYDETVDVVSSGGTYPPSLDSPVSINGPVANGQYITLPNNSREGNVAQYYSVGKGILEVLLNGQFIDIESGAYVEVGNPGSPSNQIQLVAFPGGGLVVGDELQFRFSGAGGSSGAEGPQGPPGVAGPQGPAGQNAAGGPVSVSIKTGNYSVLSTDCFLAADCSSNSVTFTMPPSSGNTGRIFYFKKIDSTSNSMIVVGSGSDTIDGSSISTVVQYEAFSLISNGSNGWWLF